MEQIYFLSVLNKGELVTKYCVVGMENVRKASSEIKAQGRKRGFNYEIGCNKAVTCFDGYLVNGDFVGMV